MDVSKRCRCVMWILCFGFVAVSPTVVPAQQKEISSYQELRSLLRSGQSEEEILAALRKSSVKAKFVLGDDQVRELKKMRVSDEFIAELKRLVDPSAAASGDITDFVVILDCSGSMKDRIGTSTKMELAKEATKKLLSSIPEGRNLSFIIYGHDAELECKAVKVVQPLGEYTAEAKKTLRAFVDGLQPAGHTPIARSVRAAGDELAKNSNALSSVILLTDGIETCHKPDGSLEDPAEDASAVAKRFRLRFGVTVVALGLKTEELAAVKKISQATGGETFDAQKPEQLIAFVDEIVKEQVKPAKSDKESIVLWCEPYEPAWGTANLHSEISINGKVVETFTSSKAKDVGGLLKQGWNTITMTTPAGAPYGNGNYLRFQFGPVHKGEDDKLVMSPVIWRFTNGLDWQNKGGKWTHQSDPDAKEVTLTFTVYLGHPEQEGGEAKKGDYILQAATFRDGATQPVTSTVTVNGTTLTSFVSLKRDIVITPLLKNGKNVVEIVTHRVPNVIYDWHSTITVAGPGEWNATEDKYQFKEIVKLNNLDGWTRDRKTGKWTNKDKPEEETVKRVLTFSLDEVPKGR